MRADEPIGIHELNRMGPRKTARYINQMRYNNLVNMSKHFNDIIPNYLACWGTNGKSKCEQCERIAKMFEARAKRIKDGM